MYCVCYTSTDSVILYDQYRNNWIAIASTSKATAEIKETSMQDESATGKFERADVSFPVEAESNLAAGSSSQKEGDHFRRLRCRMGMQDASITGLNHSLPHSPAQALWSLFTTIEASARAAEPRERTSIHGSRSRIRGVQSRSRIRGVQSHIWNRGLRLMRSESEFGGRAIYEDINDV
jgi:hypothetical protein